MTHSETIKQRIGDFRAYCARHRLAYKEVADAAEINYDSLKTNMRSGEISIERLDVLEQTAIDLVEGKVSAQTA